MVVFKYNEIEDGDMGVVEDGENPPPSTPSYRGKIIAALVALIALAWVTKLGHDKPPQPAEPAGGAAAFGNPADDGLVPDPEPVNGPDPNVTTDSPPKKTTPYKKAR